jgi:hypothetical protein
VAIEVRRKGSALGLAQRDRGPTVDGKIVSAITRRAGYHHRLDW